MSRLRRILGMTPVEIVRLSFARASHKWSRSVQRRRDQSNATYGAHREDEPLHRYMPRLSDKDLAICRDAIAGVTRNYLEHRYDLLGSGWTRVGYGMTCRGTENFSYPPIAPPAVDRAGDWLTARINLANRAEARRVWQLVDGDYVPIDWQLDFKSGFRWSEKTWYADIRFGESAGADIKVPWELARMQHLPQLALAYMAATHRGDAYAQPPRYAREFRNQVLDFIATNPPRFGVNWHGTMDVAIRAVNWLVAYDLFAAGGAQFDNGFDTEFQRSIHAHGTHIAANLEWHPRYRGNHYLANVAGLLFIAAYLAQTPMTARWLAFAQRELISEVRRQFNADGSNFEGSTCYHRLAAEMVVYATALSAALPRDRARLPFPGWYWDRLGKMAEFTRDLIRPDGAVVQIGDNDSGRFLKLDVRYQKMTSGFAKQRYANLATFKEFPDTADYWDEDVLDHSALVIDIATLLHRDDLLTARASPRPSSCVIAMLTGGVSAPAGGSAELRANDTEVAWDKCDAHLAQLSKEQASVRRFVAPAGLRGGLRVAAYPEFGVYVFNSWRMFLAIRCGQYSRDGLGAHAHNDQLSVELVLDGRDMVRDPGTYLYTAAAAQRDAYRSVSAHATPRIAGTEPAELAGLFELRDKAHARCLYAGPRGFVGVHDGFGAPVYRRISLFEDEVRIEDISLAGPLEDCWTPSSQGRRLLFSNKYGALLQ